MAIDDELEAQILRYHFVEHWRVTGWGESPLGGHLRDRTTRGEARLRKPGLGGKHPC